MTDLEKWTAFLTEQKVFFENDGDRTLVMNNDSTNPRVMGHVAVITIEFDEEGGLDFIGGWE